jgi:hypothetical protein
MTAESVSMLSKLKYLFLGDCDRINGEVLSSPALITVEVLDCKTIHSYTALFQENSRNIMKVTLNLVYKGAIEKLNEETITFIIWRRGRKYLNYIRSQR